MLVEQKNQILDLLSIMCLQPAARCQRTLFSIVQPVRVGSKIGWQPLLTQWCAYILQRVMMNFYFNILLCFNFSILGSCSDLMKVTSPSTSFNALWEHVSDSLDLLPFFLTGCSYVGDSCHWHAKRHCGRRPGKVDSLWLESGGAEIVLLQVLTVFLNSWSW